MTNSSAASAVVVLVGALACDRASDLSALAAPQATKAVAVGAQDRSDGAAPACAPGALPGGAEAWRLSFSQDDVLQVTSVATDNATGAVFVARAAGEMFKVDRSGNVAWEKPFGSVVATDARGVAHVAGTFSGTLGLGTRTLTSAGGTDVFIAEIGTDGAVSSGIALGGVADEAAVGIAVDAHGNTFVSGSGLGTVAVDAAGGTLWQKDFFGHIAVDSTGSVLLTGALTGTMTFGADTLGSRGGDDVFVAKLDGAGHTIFARGFGDAGITQRGEAIAVDPEDNILVSGIIDGTVDFGGGALGVRPGTCPAESFCSLAGFVVKLDPSGRHLWSQALAPVRSLPGIASDSQGNLLISGASPGNAPPYRIPLFVQFDADGGEVPQPLLDVGLPASGAGHGVGFDACDNVLWALSISPSPGTSEQSVLLKLAR